MIPRSSCYQSDNRGTSRTRPPTFLLERSQARPSPAPTPRAISEPQRLHHALEPKQPRNKAVFTSTQLDDRANAPTRPNPASNHVRNPDVFLRGHGKSVWMRAESAYGVMSAFRAFRDCAAMSCCHEVTFRGVSRSVVRVGFLLVFAVFVR